MPVYRLSSELVFPFPHLAIDEGLLAVGGDLSVQRLLLAYSKGIFPWYSKGEPILWWSPDPRLVLYPADLNISRRLQRTLRQGRFQVTFDQAFDQVIQGCSSIPRGSQEGTWITEEMIAAYIVLHQEGFAHSVEAWWDGRLAGGLYGVSLGGSFFGESMFHLASDASNVALATLVWYLTKWDFELIDCQVNTDHLIRMGAREISRNRFLRQLEASLKKPTMRGKWAAMSKIRLWKDGPDS
ncbi:MAG: leucyl/phenylalanyl-tRNA--protein transferase [Thermodesulfobacteriota bacterium]|nr:leucyl/phenylalanyl-tRNA--protein transferase [Thermodesulfobacteriota bacterium]